MRILLPVLLFGATACTQTAQDVQRQADADAGARTALDRELAGLIPGRPQNCVTQTDLRGGLKSYGDTLVYSTTGSVKYVNQTSGGCEGVGDNAILVTKTPSSLLCRGDIATTVDRATRVFSGSCNFGDFVQYRKAPGEG